MTKAMTNMPGQQTPVKWSSSIHCLCSLDEVVLTHFVAVDFETESRLALLLGLETLFGRGVIFGRLTDTSGPRLLGSRSD